MKLDKIINIIYVNSEISIIIIDRKLKKRDLSDAHTYLIIISVRVREIKNYIYEINKYIIYEIYLFNKKNKNERVIIIKTTRREIYLVNKLVVDILLENDILILKEVNLLFLKKIAYIDSYNINILIEVHSKKSLIRRVINSKKVLIVSLYLNIIVTIYYLNLSN